MHCVTQSEQPEPQATDVRAAILARRKSQTVKRPGGKTRSKHATSQLLAREKQRQALELRKGGATYDQIAKAVGYTDASGSRRAVEAAIKTLYQEPKVDLRVLQVERLNHMLLAMWPKVQQGDERTISTSLQVMTRMDALMGTESLPEVNVNVHHDAGILVIDGSKDDFIAGMRRMVGIQGDGSNKAIEGTVVAEEVAVDADVVEDQAEEVIDFHPKPTETVVEVGGGKKSYKFSMDPTAKAKADT